MRIKLYSPYHHFPNHEAVDGEPYIPCYNDFHVKDNLEPNPIALLIEPRSLQPSIYSWIEQNYQKFKLVFTHDSILLSMLPNARLILWGGVCSWSDDRYHKTKGISFCSSDKEMCIQHIRRKELCKSLEGVIDTMGTYNSGSNVTTAQIYKDYMFSVCIENYQDDWWFTEKICNAFANKCIPIYYGARKIGKFFDEDGIIRVDDLNDLHKTIKYLLYDTRWEYGHRNKAVDYNYERVKEFADFERWFFKRYEGELNDLYNQTQADRNV